MEKISNKEDKKKSVANESGVIIRRTIVNNEIDTKKDKQVKPEKRREDFGKIHKNKSSEYNIVYKEREDKPLSISELFGLGKKKTENSGKEIKKTAEGSKEIKKTQIKGEKVIDRRNSQRVSNERNTKRQTSSGKVTRENNQFDKNRRFKNDQKPVRQFQKNTQVPIATENNDKDYARDVKSRLIEKEKKEKMEQTRTDRKKGRSKSNSRDFANDSLNFFKGSSNLSEQFSSGEALDFYEVADRRRKKQKTKTVPVKKEQAKLSKITISENITIKTLAQELKITVSEILKKLMENGIIANINQSIDYETAYLIAGEYGVEVNKKNVVSFKDQLMDKSEDNEKDLEERPPVIVVMGHVDHGKTSLLDAIRSEDENVVDKESGGITQHIGAYQVKVNGKVITFLDTPGHEAFTSMRKRGASVTDIAILVVAANDGIMPQTVEAINHAKAANVPIIVAINKIDLPGADPEKVKRELMEHELIPEEWGGNTICVNISAKEKTNIDTLLEMILLQAEMLNLKANPKRQATGTVIESKLDKSKGTVVTMLVQNGTLTVGDTIVVDTSIGRIRKMVNYKGSVIKKATASTPVEVTGLTSVPKAGEIFIEVKNEKVAKKFIEEKIKEEREKKLALENPITLEGLFNKIKTDNLKTLNIILKTDVAGTREALKKSLEELSTDEVRVKVIHSNVGAITDSDVSLAKVSGAIIIGFNVRPDIESKKAAEDEGVEIKLYSVIYGAIEDVKLAMIGMLDPEFEEKVLGTAEVRQLFKVSHLGTIAGCYITSGKVTRNSKVRVIRDNIVLIDTKIISLKREKDDVKEVLKGFECGILLENFNEFKELDVLEFYEMVEKERKLK